MKVSKKFISMESKYWTKCTVLKLVYGCELSCQSSWQNESCSTSFNKIHLNGVKNFNKMYSFEISIGLCKIISTRIYKHTNAFWDMPGNERNTNNSWEAIGFIAATLHQSYDILDMCDMPEILVKWSYQDKRWVCADFSFCCNIWSSWFSLEQNCSFIVDKLSSTAVDFIRSEEIAERQHLIWGKASSLSMPRTYRGVKSVT